MGHRLCSTCAPSPGCNSTDGRVGGGQAAGVVPDARRPRARQPGQVARGAFHPVRHTPSGVGLTCVWVRGRERTQPSREAVERALAENELGRLYSDAYGQMGVAVRSYAYDLLVERLHGMCPGAFKARRGARADPGSRRAMVIGWTQGSGCSRPRWWPRSIAPPCWQPSSRPSMLRRVHGDRRLRLARTPVDVAEDGIEEMGRGR